MIGCPNISPPCGLSRSLQFGKKQQFTSLDEVRNTQNLDTFVDGKLPNDQDYASVFSMVIGSKLLHVSIKDLYLHCRMNFSSNVVQTKAPQLVDLGLPDINTLNESGVLGTPDTSIQSFC